MNRWLFRIFSQLCCFRASYRVWSVFLLVAQSVLDMKVFERELACYAHLQPSPSGTHRCDSTASPGLVDLVIPIADVEAAAPQVVGSVLPFVPKCNQIHQEQVVAGWWPWTWLQISCNNTWSFRTFFDGVSHSAPRRLQSAPHHSSYTAVFSHHQRRVLDYSSCPWDILLHAFDYDMKDTLLRCCIVLLEQNVSAPQVVRSFNLEEFDAPVSNPSLTLCYCMPRIRLHRADHPCGDLKTLNRNSNFPPNSLCCLRKDFQILRPGSKKEVVFYKCKKTTRRTG